MGGGCVAKIFCSLSLFFFGFPSVSKMNECILLLLLLWLGTKKRRTFNEVNQIFKKSKINDYLKKDIRRRVLDVIIKQKQEKRSY